VRYLSSFLCARSFRVALEKFCTFRFPCAIKFSLSSISSRFSVLSGVFLAFSALESFSFFPHSSTILHRQFLRIPLTLHPARFILRTD
jgi:hypothetical protein